MNFWSLFISISVQTLEYVRSVPSVMFTHFPAGRYTSRLFISAERTGATMLMCGKVTHRARQTAAPYSECQIQLFLITVSGNFILRVDYEFIDAIM